MARLEPGGLRDVGPFTWVFSRAAGRVLGTEPPAVFLTLGRHRGLFLGWLHFAGRLMPGGKLARRETELVILRVAHLAGCAYEFEHHVLLGRRAGLTDDDVDRVMAGPDARGWSPREELLLRVVDQLHHHRDLDDDLWLDLLAELDERRIIELLLLVGHYEMLATTLITLRVEPDRRRQGRPASR